MNVESKSKTVITISWTDPGKYRQRDLVMGDTLKLLCNTTESSRVAWRWFTTHGRFSYDCLSGNITGYPNLMKQFSVVNTSEGECSLMIRNIHPTDSGLYDCETNGTKIVGYQLVVTSMFLITFQNE